MELTSGIQEGLLALLCYDDTPQGAKSVRGLVPARTFDPFFRDIAELAEKYLEKYKTPPGEHTWDIIQTLQARKPDHKEIYDRIWTSLQSTKDSVNRDYMVAQASRFARFQRMRAGITKALDLLQSDKETSVDEAEAVLAGTLKHTYELFAPGLLLNDPVQALRFLHQEDEYFSTGIPELDKYSLGPMRKGLHLLMALPNRGKSWWGIQLGRHAMVERRQVLHITLEMGEHKVAQRYVQAFLSVSKRKEEIKRLTFEYDKHGHFLDINEMDVGRRPSLQDGDIEKVLKVRVKRVLGRRPKLIIKQFPTGQLTIRDLTAYLDNLEGSMNFIPDLIILDYADLMKVSSKFHREDIGRIYQELRGVAVERNVAVATMTQSNRDGLKSKLLTEGNTSEDFSKVHTADTIITYNQTDEEYRLGLARLFVAKARDDVARHRILISQAYKIGQFCLESVRMGNESNYWTRVDKDKEVEED